MASESSLKERYHDLGLSDGVDVIRHVKDSLQGIEIGCLDGIIVCHNCRERQTVPLNVRVEMTGLVVGDRITAEYEFKGILCETCTQNLTSNYSSENHSIVSVTLFREECFTPEIIDASVNAADSEGGDKSNV